MQRAGDRRPRHRGRTLGRTLMRVASARMSSPTDLYLSDELLTDEERALRDRLHDFCEREVTPVINEYWERAQFPFELVPMIADLGLAGAGIKVPTCPGESATTGGLVR